MENGKFHIDHTGRGRDLSPDLILENLSPEAKTLAVTLEDMSHPIKGFTHWVEAFYLLKLPQNAAALEDMPLRRPEKGLFSGAGPE